MRDIHVKTKNKLPPRYKVKISSKSPPKVKFNVCQNLSNLVKNKKFQSYHRGWNSACNCLRKIRHFPQKNSSTCASCNRVKLQSTSKYFSCVLYIKSSYLSSYLSNNNQNMLCNNNSNMLLVLDPKYRQFKICIERTCDKPKVKTLGKKAFYMSWCTVQCL